MLLYIYTQQQTTTTTTTGNNMTPINAKTGKEYSGGNIVLLAQNDFSESIWATYRQWQDLGMQVQKGQKGTRCTKMVEVIDKKTNKAKKVPRGFTVFNIEQVAKIVTEEDLMETETAEDFTALSILQLNQYEWIGTECE